MSAAGRWLPPTIAALLAACAGGADPSWGNSARSSGPTGEPVLAVLTAAPAPAVLSVETRRPTPRGVLQRIVLENATTLPNENRIDLQVDLRLDSLADRLGVEPRASVVTARSTDELRAFLVAEFPSVPMTIADTEPSAAAGSYGYASGHGAGDETCLFAWQIVTPSATGAGYYRRGLSFRYCDPRRSVTELRRLFESIRVRIDPHS